MNLSTGLTCFIDGFVSESLDSFDSVQTQIGIIYDGDGDVVVSNGSPEESLANTDTWPFSSNSEHLGSDLLSQLFSTLKITPPEDLSKYPAPNLEDLDSDVEYTVESQYLSQSQLVALSNGSDTCTDLSLHDYHHPAANAFFSYSTPSPFAELYVFPQSVSRKKPSWRTLKAPFETETSICNKSIVMWKHMYSKFRQAGHTRHPALIKFMRGLAQEYMFLGRDSLAEKWFRRTIAANKQFGEGNCYQNVKDSLHLASVLNRQGCCVEARRLLGQIFLTIKDYDTSDSRLLSQYLRVAGWVAYNLNDYEKMSAYNHEQLQIELSHSGPWHIKAIDASEDIALALSLQGKHNEALALFSVTLQLQERAVDVQARDRCFTLRLLAIVLRNLGRFNESIAAAEQAVALGESFLGHEDTITLEAISELARTLSASGIQVRSESLHREILATVIPLFGGNSLKTISATRDLCELLVNSNRHLEASNILSPLFHQTIYGLRQANLIVFECGGFLADCYRKQSRISDAVLVCKQMLEAISDEKELGFECWLSVCQGLGALYENENMCADAITLYEETLQSIRQIKGQSHSDAIKYSYRLGRSFEKEGRFADAIALYEETLQLIQCFPERHEHDMIQWFNQHLAICYREAERYSDAVAFCELMIHTTQTTTNDAHALLDYCDVLGLCYEDQGEYAEAVEVYQQAMQHIIDTEGEEHYVIAELRVWIEKANDSLFKAIEEDDASLFVELGDVEVGSLLQNSSTTEEEEEEEDEAETEKYSTGKEEDESQYQFVYEVREILPHSA